MFFVLGQRKRIWSDRSSIGSSNNKIYTADMERIIKKLKSRQTRGSTVNNYLHIWRAFNKFIIRLDVIPSSWEERVAYFAAYQANRVLQSSTLNSYISTLKSTLTTDGYRFTCRMFELTHIIKACKISNDHVKTRLSIKQRLLNLILFEIQRIFKDQPYLQTMFKAMFALGYYGLMRVGELAKIDNTLKADNIYRGTNKRKLLIVLYTSKTHEEESEPQQIKISVTNAYESKDHIFCPFELVNDFVHYRGEYQKGEQFFFLYLGIGHPYCQNI